MLVRRKPDSFLLRLLLLRKGNSFSRVKIIDFSVEDLIVTLNAAATTTALWSPNEEEEHDRTRSRGPTPSPSTAATTTKTGSRKRTDVATIWEGRILPNEEVPSHKGRAPILQSLRRPCRDGIITQAMSDPNLSNNGYRSQEVSVSNGRTSGVFWRNSKTREQEG